MSNNKVYEYVTQRIIQRIEEAITNGTPLPWQKPWLSNNLARNYVTGIPYRGINQFLLGLEPGEFLTWNQICDQQKNNPSIRLRKGSKSEMVVYYSFQEVEKEKRTSNGTVVKEKIKIPFLRYYNVFRVDDVDGLKKKWDAVEQKHTPIVEMDKLINSYLEREKINILHKRVDRACYNPITDEITLPLKTLFKESTLYYATVCHELGHSTGHPKRLNRRMQNTFGDADYSKEELVGDMTSAIILGHFNIGSVQTEDNNVAYMRNWISVLKDDIKMLVEASTQAQKAADYILAINSEEET